MFFAAPCMISCCPQPRLLCVFAARCRDHHNFLNNLPRTGDADWRRRQAQGAFRLPACWSSSWSQRRSSTAARRQARERGSGHRGGPAADRARREYDTLTRHPPCSNKCLKTLAGNAWNMFACALRQRKTDAQNIFWGWPNVGTSQTSTPANMSNLDCRSDLPCARPSTLMP